MPRWLLLTEFFPPEHGGIQNALRIIADHFGSDVTVLTAPQVGEKQFDEVQSYRVIRKSLFSGQIKPSWVWLLPWLWKRRTEFDVIVFGHMSAAVTAGWMLRWFGVRYAIFVHGQDILSETRRSGHAWLVRSMVKNAEWIGVNSSFTVQAVEKFGGRPVQMVKTHPAVPASLVTEAKSVPSMRLITICRLVPRKNVEVILRAVATLQSEFSNMHYDIIGDGPERSRLESLSHELGLVSRVTFHGAVDDATKFRILQAATVLVMTPTVREAGSDTEGLGIVYLEAAAFGKPMIASATGGVGDIVQDHQTGFIVDPTSPSAVANAIREVFINKPFAEKLGHQGQMLVKKEFTDVIRNQRIAWLLGQRPRIPKVSIVVPVYNHADLLSTTFASIQAQTWPAIETIVVNDGSTDHIDQAMESWKSKVKYLTQTNQGAPVARNAGAKQAIGEYLLFVDADTLLDPSLVERMVQTLEVHPDVSYTYCGHRFGIKGFPSFPFDPARLRRMNYIHTTSMMRRIDFPGFDPGLKRFQDWDLWLTMLENGKTGIQIPQELFRVQQGQGGMKASAWIPKIVYRLPLVGRGVGNESIRKYREAESIIRKKHHLR